MKIGYIDYYLDNWHANEYPAMLRKADSEAVVAYAYGMIPSPLSGMTSAQWCEKYGVELCLTIEEVVEKSDVLCVLSPEHPEMHMALAQAALRSGKPTFIDKTFAPTKKVAQEIFDLADKYGTPCFSASALRFSAEYQPLRTEEISAASFIGPSVVDNYSIHQLEPLVMLMKGAPKRVLGLRRDKWLQLTMEWCDGRCATVLLTGEWTASFSATLNLGSKCEAVTIKEDFFAEEIKALLHFYKTGEIPVPHEETIAVAALREACMIANEHPGVWVDVP